MYVKSNRGLVSLTCCSGTNVPCLWCSCMYSASQQFIFVPFVHGFNNFRVCSTGPNSCLLLRMCIAYAEVGLLCLFGLHFFQGPVKLRNWSVPKLGRSGLLGSGMVPNRGLGSL
jgi:hypothetical protein